MYNWEHTWLVNIGN